MRREARRLSAAARGAPGRYSPLIDHEMRAADRVVALDVAVLGRHPHVDPRPSRVLAVPRDRAREPHVVAAPRPRRARRRRRGACRWSAQTPSTITTPVGLDRPRARAVSPCGPVVRARTSRPRRGRAASTTSRSRRSRSKPSPSQNSSVETICAPGTIRASVVFPAAPCPPMPTRVRPSSCRAAAIRSSTGRGVHRSTVPSPHGQAAARRHGSLERSPRPRPDVVGRRGARGRRLDPRRPPAPSGGSRRA